MSDEVEKKLNFQVSLYDEGISLYMGQNLECLWNISIVGRNSWVSKVLSYEMSDEVEKILNFQVSLYDEGRF